MRRTTKGTPLPGLRQLRESRDISRKQIKDATGIDTATIYRLETGRTGASAQTVEDLASFFGVPADSLKKNMHAGAI